jgi:hypothetical protein
MAETSNLVPGIGPQVIPEDVIGGAQVTLPLLHVERRQRSERGVELGRWNQPPAPVTEPLVRYQVGDRLAVHRDRKGLTRGYSPHDLCIVLAQLKLLDRSATESGIASDSGSAMR